PRFVLGDQIIEHHTARFTRRRHGRLHAASGETIEATQILVELVLVEQRPRVVFGWAAQGGAQRDPTVNRVIDHLLLGNAFSFGDGAELLHLADIDVEPQLLTATAVI